MSRTMLYIIAALLGYVLLLSVLTVAQRSLIYFPGKVMPDAEALGLPEMREVSLPVSSDAVVKSWYAPPRQSAGYVVIVFQGNAGTIADRAFKARLLLDDGYGVMLVGYSGYGGNGGKPSEQALYNDARAAVDYLLNNGVNSQQLVLLGESLGAAMAIEIAQQQAVAKEPVAAVILEAPFNNLADTAIAHYPFLPVRWLLWDKYESDKKVASIGTMLLTIIGGQDQTVPNILSEKLFAAAAPPKRIYRLPQAAHNDLYAYGAADIVLGLLASLPPLAIAAETPQK